MDNQNLCYENNINDVVDSISKRTGLPTECVKAAISYIKDFPELLSENEYINIFENDEINFGRTGLTIGNGRININCRKILIFLVLLLLSESTKDIIDFNSLLPTISILLANELRNDSFRDIVNFPNENIGEKCILMEVLLLTKNQRYITANMINNKIYNRSCQKPYDCNYKRRGLFGSTRCKCNEQNIESILRLLKGKDILRGDTAGYSYVP